MSATANLIGIDKDIYRIESDLKTELNSIWRGYIKGYGRIYRNKEQNGRVTPNVLIDGYENEYKMVYYDDEYSCNFFFIDDEKHTTEDGIVFNTNLKVVFLVDLKRIISGEEKRNDMRAQRDVVSILRDYSYDISSIEKGVENVFKGFATDQIKFTDIHPLHCFAVNIDFSYYLDDSCN